MDAAKQSPFSSCKSKKHLHSPVPSDPKTRKASASKPDQDPWSVKTPGKQLNPPRQLGSRSTAISIKEIRQAASRRRERGSDAPARPDTDSKSVKELITTPKKSDAAEIKLPEKYELLDKFFNSLDSSIRLLRLKRSSPTFTNICSQIEILTDRRFTYSHLAQLKFIMPEAIVLEKFLQHDEHTGCLKPELRITMNVEAIESKGKLRSHTGNLLLRKVFRSRLLDFFKSHPEGDEVPEDELPEPFDRLKEDARANSTQPSVTSSKSETRDVAFSGLTVTGSHLPPSFKRGFSNRNSGHQTENSKQDQSVVSPQAKKEINEPSIPSSTLLETPVKSIYSIQDDDQCSNELPFVLKTPINMSSTPLKLMSATPMVQPPKRCCMSPDDDDSFTSPSKLVRRPPSKRPLKFDDSPVKGDKDHGWAGNSLINEEIFDILPEALVQSIQEKGRTAAMENEPAISQARWRQKMIASLPKFFDRIHFFFRSIRHSVVTKKELVQILISQLDITDMGEVEEQLRLLQELAPEWIYEKTVSSGDLLVCVNKISSIDMIRKRLSDAK